MAVHIWDSQPSSTPPLHRSSRPPGPTAEKLFRGRYKLAPSFLSIHAGVKEQVLPPGTDCHHIVVEDWARMEVSGWHGLMDAHAGFRRGILPVRLGDAPGVPCWHTRVIDSLPTGEAHRDALLPPR